MGLFSWFRDKGSQVGDLGNAIVSVFEDTCHNPWTVLIKTALPAAGTAFIMLIEVQPDEVLEEYLEPKGRRKGKRRKRTRGARRRPGLAGKTRPWARPRLPYFDGWIADRLPGRGFFRGRDVGRAEWWFWKGINIGDRLLWYWLVLDVLDNFTVQWHSNIMESRFCQKEFEVIAALSWTDDKSLPFTWWEIPEQQVQKMIGCVVGGDGRINSDPAGTIMKGTLTLYASGDTHGDPDARPNQTKLWARIRVRHPDFTTTTINGPTTFVSAGQQWEVGATIGFENARSLDIDLREDNDFEGTDTGPECFVHFTDTSLIGEHEQ